MMMLTRIVLKTKNLAWAVGGACAARVRPRRADGSACAPAAAALGLDELEALVGDVGRGLDAGQVEAMRERFGANVLARRGGDTPLYRLRRAVVNPFILILCLLMALSFATDVYFAADEPDFTKIAILSAVVVWSVAMHMVQESRSASATASLLALVKNTCAVVRAEGGERELPFEDVVCGDVVRLAAGDMVPADMRLISSKDLFVNESSLTGESEPRELSARAGQTALMGSTVVSGAGVGVVCAVGDATALGRMARDVSERPPKTSFERGVEGVSRVLLGFMAAMVPVVVLVNGLTKGDWVGALVFGMSVAIGLTPEMLPTIVTTCLAKGAVAMSRKKVIIKSLDAMQNLGAIDVLCTDKTGTLTKDRMELERYLDVDGAPSPEVLRCAYLNSFFQTGLKNLMDKAVIARAERVMVCDAGFAEACARWEKVDEIPFDFERRRMSVLVRGADGREALVTKGAVDEMLGCCTRVRTSSGVVALDAEARERVRERIARAGEDGLRVLAVACRELGVPADGGAGDDVSSGSGVAPAATARDLTVADEVDMVLVGWLAFLDPPKESAAPAIRALRAHGVACKVLTGDSERVALHVCREVGVDAARAVTGDEIERLDDAELRAVAERESVFARLNPSQKARLVRALREAGHAVGFMGDGINDAAALRAADAGISVDTAVDIAKETASVILLEKDLMVLEDGIVEGRRTYANMIKYLKMTASSNLGNMFSVLAASAFLPFTPMAALQLILLDMVYSVTCLAVPWDRVDAEALREPARWDARGIADFMVWMGPVSSVFDIAMFAVLFFAVCPAVLGGAYGELAPAAQLGFAMLFQTGWCIESMWTQTLVVHLVRTERLPFVESRPAPALAAMSAAGILLMTVLPYTPAAPLFGLSAGLPWWYFAVLVAFVALYMALATAVKGAYVRRHGRLL